MHEKLSMALIYVIAFLIVAYCDFFEINTTEEINWLIFSATLALAVIAWIQFGQANKLSRNEFLLFISNRWGCSEIVSARKLIHELFIKNYRDSKGKKMNYECALHQTSHDTLNLSREQDSKF